MKIIVYSIRTKDFFIKPDSSLVTDSRDFFVPDFFKGISIATAIVIKISKSAKCISSQYAERYYNEFSIGLVLYPEDLLKTNVGYFSTSRFLTADNTAYIIDSFHPKEVSKIEQIAFSVDRDIKFDFSASNDFLNEINKAIEDITLYSSLKCGDLIMLEINEMIPISKGNNIKLSYSDRICLDFCIR